MFDKLEQYVDSLILSDKETPAAFEAALSFFIYDSIKIVILLLMISVIMGFINAWLPVDRLNKMLAKRNFFGLEYFFAALFGAITPFCSCSSIPIFIGFLRGGIPLGICLSFLITSPLINEVAVASFLGAFGLKSTILYVSSGLALGTFTGGLLGKMKLEKYLSPWLLSELSSEKPACGCSKSKGLKNVLKDAFGITMAVFPYILIGVGIGAAIHGYVPEGFFEEYLSKDNMFAVPLAVICGLPLYANAAGIVPIVQVLVAKGVAVGTAMSFMMAVVGLSLPEAMLLKKVMTWKLIAVFFSIVAFSIMFLGFLFNIIV